MKFYQSILVFSLACVSLTNLVKADEVPTTTVGMPGRLVDLRISGPRLEVKPIDRDAAVVVRLLQTIGDGPNRFRYEFEYYCLEPGEYNLADYLQRADGSTIDVSPIIVRVATRSYKQDRWNPMLW